MENTEEYKGCTIEIHNDDSPMNPFEDWDGIGKIVFHPNARHVCNTDITYDEARETPFSVPLSAYIHSGIALSVLGEGYRCRWDTSDNIAIWTPDQENAPVKRRKTAEKYARQACELFNQWANGEVYGVESIDPSGNQIGACWGYYGDEAVRDGIKEAKSEIDYHLKEAAKIIPAALGA